MDHEWIYTPASCEGGWECWELSTDAGTFKLWRSQNRWCCVFPDGEHKYQPREKYEPEVAKAMAIVIWRMK